MKNVIFLFITFNILLFSCDSGQQTNSNNEESVPVDVVTVKRGDVVQSLSYSGDIKAAIEVKVFSKIPDRIQTFYVDEGDFVRKGQPVAEITATTIEQGVKQAEAALIAVKAQDSNLLLEYERAKRLNKEDAMSKAQYDAVKTQYEAVHAQVEQAEAALKSARSQLNDATITASISGIIGKRYYEIGDLASPGPLLSIVEMDKIKIEFNATEEDIGKLSLGQKAEIITKVYPDTTFFGKVNKISPILDPLTRMADVEVLVDNPQHILKPGMFAQVQVTTGIIEDVIVVPRFAAIESTILENNNGDDKVVRNYYVFVVDSNKAVQRKLDVNYVNHKWIAINNGIKIGEQLVVMGQNNLRDGVPVLLATKEQ